MNEKITLPGLTQLLSIATGDTRKQSEDFIKDFFSVISSALAEGEQVKIKDFGVFKTIAVEARKSVNVSTGEENKIPAHRKVVFVPSKEIAALVNEPFEMFESVELEDEEVLNDTQENLSINKDCEIDVFESDALLPVNDESEFKDEKTNLEQNNPVSDLAVPDNESGQPVNDQDEYVKDRIINAEESEKEIIYSSVDEEQASTVEYVLDESDNKNLEEYMMENDIHNDSDRDAVSGAIPDQSVADTIDKDETNDSDSSSELPVTQYTEKEAYNHRLADKKKNKNFLWGFLTGFGAALLAVVLFSIIFYYFSDFELKKYISYSTDTRKEVILVDTVIVGSVNKQIATDTLESVLNEDSEMSKEKTGVDIVPPTSEQQEVAPTRPSDEKVYDTISKTRYLTTMAKDHYGNFNLWPYIYIENKAFLGHPDRIKPGTKVVIPPLSKYGIDPNNPDDIAKAKKKGVEIYSKYK